MATLGSQKLSQYYELYGSKELAFNRSIIVASGIEPKKVFLKIRGEHYPCVIYSCSMKLSKVIINLDTSAFEEIKKAKNFVSLRLSFFPRDIKSPIVFFVPSLVKGYNTFNSKSEGNSFLMSIEFTQKPPDDLIEILGKILESAENFEKRQSLRITLDRKIIEDIGFLSNKAVVTIDNIRRPCIIRNVSSFGCMIILACNAKFVMNKKVVITLPLRDSKFPLEIDGTILRSEEIEDRKDLAGLGVQFTEDKISYEYKDLLNRYIDKLEEIVKKKT